MESIIQDVESEPEIKQKFLAPLNYDEFLEWDHISDWPEYVSSEKPVSLKDIANSIGTLEDITKWLLDSAVIDMKPLDDLDSRLEFIRSDLNFYADKMIATDSKRQEDGDFNKVEYEIMRLSKKVNESSALLKTQRNRMKQSKKGGKNIHELKGKSLQQCIFPGFFDREFTEMPGSIEVPQILHKVSKAAPVPRGFRSFWKKIFLSEASVAFVQDSFWWFFLDLFDTDDRLQDRRKLFGRISDSFVALFVSIHPEVKDHFFIYFPERVAMALYSAFIEAFPESRKSFGDEFKQTLINTVTEWVTGGHPLPQTYKSWNIDILESSNLPVTMDNPSEMVVNKSVADSVMQAMVSMSDPREFKLDIEGFEKSLRQLKIPQTNSKRRVTIVTNKDTSLASEREDIATLATNRSKPKTPKDLATIPSHPMGEGPSVHLRLFDLSGSCPLIQHYLAIHGKELRRPADVRSRVRRSEINKMPEGNITYQEFIEEHKERRSKMKTEYLRIKSETESALKEIAHRNLQISQKIERLQNEMDETSVNTTERKLSILSE